MHIFEYLAEMLLYPAPGRLQTLAEGLRDVPSGPVRKNLEGFLKAVSALTIGEWEELHTRTLDLNPLAAPYLGYQMWGDSYQRGAFMAKMNRALWEARVDPGGELPDHLIPVLRYLAAVPAPAADLLDILEPSLVRLRDNLRKADPHNPYNLLLEAISTACAGQSKMKHAEEAAAAEPACMVSGGKV